MNLLAPRERQVLAELLEGRTEASIADRLSISRHTVHAHIRSLYAKLRVHNRVELMRRVLSYADDPMPFERGMGRPDLTPSRTGAG
jgi:DNA-binding CsgD family transcriptional regulator